MADTSAAEPCEGAIENPITFRVTPRSPHYGVGDRATLTIAWADTDATLDTLLPRWETSNPTIVTVKDDGSVHAVEVGDARVTACLLDTAGRLRGRNSTIVSVSNRVFSLDASVGAAIKLNGDTGKTASQLAGLTGEVVIANLRTRRTADVELLTGPLTLTGNLFVTLAAAAVPNDSSTPADTTLHFGTGSYGWLRLGVPLMTVRRVIRLYAIMEDGYVALRSQPNSWREYYVGGQLQMGSSESFVEILWGKSENLRPATTRCRITVQLQIPQTPLTFRLVNNRAPGSVRGDPATADSPIGVAVFTKIPLANFFRALGVLP